MEPVGELLPMSRDEVVAACARLPIFPLPHAVLMPSAQMPLHVFEPRYRALVRHCLTESPLLGIATLVPGYEADYHGAPPVFPEIGVGRLVGHEALPDGRSNILLAAVGRARLVDEIASPHPFRLVRCALRDDVDAGAEEALVRLRALVLQIVPNTDASRDESLRFVRLPPRRMVDELAMRLLETSHDQRAYLATDRLVEGAEWVQERLARIVALPGSVAEA